jgi:serine/threonine-protein kinase
VRPGTQIGANVRLDRMLSEGGMGSIWVADHLTLGTQVAVKFIASDLVENSGMLARFQLEATSAAQIKSPHVVQVFDHGVTDEGQPYIVMELLHGEDLDMRIERLGKLSLAETALVMRHACKALSAAHKLRLVHRDIKPANLFVVETDGELFVKVLDFGIAKRRADSGDVTGVTNTGAMVGTPHFMSPEQVTSSRHADPSADLWAVAVVAYNCLLGRRPFEGETVGALCIAIHAGRFLLPSEIAPTLPPALDAWFERALARDPAARFTSAKELSDTFAACLPASARSMRPEPVSSTGRSRSTAPTLAAQGQGGVQGLGSAAVPARSVPQTLGGAAVKTDPGKTRSRALAGAALVIAALGGVTVWLAIPRGVGSAPAAASVAISAVPASASEPATASATASEAATGTAIATATTATTTTTTTTATPLHTAPHASHTPATSVTPPAPPIPKDRGF